MSDIKLSSVLKTQTLKSIVLVGCSVMESLLYYLLVKKSAHSTTEWELKIVMHSNQKKMNEVQTKVDSCIYTKLPYPKTAQMNFDTIIQKAKSNKILGSSSGIYSKLDKLRKLRNKVHLQVIDNPTDTDWNSFSKSEVNDIDEILYSVFTSSIFRPSAHEKTYFQYLYDYYKT